MTGVQTCALPISESRDEEGGGTDDDPDDLVVDVAEELDSEVDILLLEIEVIDEFVAIVLDDVEIPLIVEFCQADPTNFAFMVTPIVPPPAEKILTSVP